MNHTPGKWYVQGNEVLAPSPRYPGSHLQIATVYETAMLKDEPDHAASDAALISASPDLIEALKQSLAIVLLDWAEWKQENLPRYQWDAKPEDLPTQEYASSIIKSRAAIAKAEARS